MHTYGMRERTGRAWILNESHLKRSDVVTWLLTTLEELPEHAVMIFATTTDGNSRIEDGFDAKPS